MKVDLKFFRDFFSLESRDVSSNEIPHDVASGLVIRILFSKVTF